MNPIEGVINWKLFFLLSFSFPCCHAGVNNEAAFCEYRRNASISQGIESAIGSDTAPRYNISCCAGRSKWRCWQLYFCCGSSFSTEYAGKWWNCILYGFVAFRLSFFALSSLSFIHPVFPLFSFSLSICPVLCSGCFSSFFAVFFLISIHLQMIQSVLVSRWDNPRTTRRTRGYFNIHSSCDTLFHCFPLMWSVHPLTFMRFHISCWCVLVNNRSNKRRINVVTR